MKKEEYETLKTRIMLLSFFEYKKLFPTENALCDNSPNGVTLNKTVSFLQKHGIKNGIEIYSLNGITDDAREFLNAVNIKYSVHSGGEIVEACKNTVLPQIEKVNSKRKFTEKLKNLHFGKATIKYGVMLLIFSIITPYRIYYIISGSILIALSVFFLMKKKLNQRNQIQGHQF